MGPSTVQADSSWSARSDELHRQVCSLIARACEPAAGSRAEIDAAVDRLAIELARFQAEHIEPVANLFRARGIEPASLQQVADIPAVPCDAFRYRRIAVHPPEHDERCFRTSGTTLGSTARGQHPLRTTSTYAEAALGWSRHMLWPDGDELGFIGLVAPETAAADSSLAFMLARFAEQLRGPASWHFDGRELDGAGLTKRCAETRATGQPALVAGTSFAFVELCDTTSPGALALPPGSRVMQTGGFKGRSRTVDGAELRARIAELFALPERQVVGEYGMTELSSQLYQGSVRRVLGKDAGCADGDGYYPPPWLRVAIVDPVDLCRLPQGEVGLVQLLDLANVDSAVAILTADRGRLLDDGSLELLGRSPGAVPRGCSLTLEEALRDGLGGSG